MALETSILRSIRQRIGPSADYEIFDTDLIVNINASFSRLCQLGIGPSTPFRITGTAEAWNDFMSDDTRPADVEQYVYLKAKLVFDPPQSSTVINLMKEEAEKLEWLLKDFYEYGY